MLGKISYPSVHVKMVGEDGNIFAIIGRVNKALREAGISKAEREQFMDDITQASDYSDALGRITHWVTVE